jgi:hypothetical protein
MVLLVLGWQVPVESVQARADEVVVTGLPGGHR